MTDKTPQQLKAEALDKLNRLIRVQAGQLRAIDERMLTYFQGLTDGDLHNLYEILGGIKFLRILRTYAFSHKRVRHAIQLYEGRWDGNVYIPNSGGLQFSGLKGFTHYQLQPFQVFALAGLLGPQTTADDGKPARLCKELVLFLTRKSGKTLMAAFINFIGFFFWDSSYEGYCCANSSDQAKLLYKTSQALIRQMDPKETRIRFTASQTNWRPSQPRQASFTALSAGGKTKDGLYAQACFADEFGSADFTNGKSDMLDLVNVVQSSMGPRREPLTVITTTAGYATNGPFRSKMLIMEQQLEKELDMPDDYRDSQPDDYQHALLLQPDKWEQLDEDMLLTDERIWRKSNPMIGISVQPSFYEQEAYKARMNPDNRKEFITKLVNVYENARVTEWMKSDQVRRVQIPRRVTDCTKALNWGTFVGLDFGGTDDFFAVATLSVDYSRRDSMLGRFFGDLTAWIVESALERSPNRPLYERWIEDGWLRVSPGKTFNPDLAINELMSLSDKGVNILAFGYDPAQSKWPINTLKAWLQTLGIEPQVIQQMVIPVSQNFMTFNGLIGEVEQMILEREPWLQLSQSPLWPWMFGNCRIEESGNGNRRVVKATPTQKVDGVHALIDAMYCFDLSEARI